MRHTTAEILTIAQEAEQEFWSTVSHAFPHVRTGDLPPDVAHQFRVACCAALAAWLDVNDRPLLDVPYVDVRGRPRVMRVDVGSRAIVEDVSGT